MIGTGSCCCVETEPCIFSINDMVIGCDNRNKPMLTLMLMEVELFDPPLDVYNSTGFLLAPESNGDVYRRINTADGVQIVATMGINVGTCERQVDSIVFSKGGLTTAVLVRVGDHWESNVTTFCDRPGALVELTGYLCPRYWLDPSDKNFRVHFNPLSGPTQVNILPCNCGYDGVEILIPYGLTLAEVDGVAIEVEFSGGPTKYTCQGQILDDGINQVECSDHDDLLATPPKRPCVTSVAVRTYAIPMTSDCTNSDQRLLRVFSAASGGSVSQPNYNTAVSADSQIWYRYCDTFADCNQPIADDLYTYFNGGSGCNDAPPNVDIFGAEA